MKLNRRTLDKLKKQQSTIVTEGIQLKGEVKGTHDILLYGEFEGKIELSGVLFVGKTGRINGEIEAKTVIIEGNIEGKLTADEKVEIRDGGKYKGDVVAASILVSEKALVDGNVSVKAEGKEPPVEQFTEKRSPQSDTD
jgi:cytoskeletal protein CcmA (bactofilin family)